MVLAVKRIMSQKEMRKQTEHKYQKCLEVKNKKVEKNRNEEYKTNKIMVSIFNKVIKIILFNTFFLIRNTIFI